MRSNYWLANVLFAMMMSLGCAETSEPADEAAAVEESASELRLRWCAGPLGLSCGSGQYCSARGEGACPSKKQYGVCVSRPSACSKEYAPVCGCDGKTYGNACVAAAAGVARSARGECNPDGICTDNADCLATDFCQFAEGQCGGDGHCQPRPQACTFLYDPVCGCDGRTYGNACDASGTGVSVDHPGMCMPKGPFCGGIAGIACEDGGSCIDDPSDACDPEQGGADCGGICVCPPNPCASARCAQGRQCAVRGCSAVCEPVDDGCGGCGPGQYCCDPLHNRCVPVGDLCAL